MKYSLSLIAINFFISFFYNIISKTSNSYDFINCSFVIGMFYLLFGLLSYVWEKGFFNITLYSFKKINNQIQKRKGLLTNEYSISLDDYIYKENKFFLTSNLLICGSIISILCIIISFLFI